MMDQRDSWPSDIWVWVASRCVSVRLVVDLGYSVACVTFVRFISLLDPLVLPCSEPHTLTHR